MPDRCQIRSVQREKSRLLSDRESACRELSPARLAILTALASCKTADFLFLQRLTGLSGGNLSSHITKLQEEGLVSVEKQFVEKRPNTRIELTDKGRAATREHWKKLESLGEKAKNWKN